MGDHRARLVVLDRGLVWGDRRARLVVLDRGL